MPDALISGEEARRHLADGNARMLVVGREEPALPQGAHFVEASAFRDGRSRGVAGPAALQRLCARCRIAEDTLVLLADAAGGGPHSAFAFWTLALYGHDRLALVDGGVPAIREKRANGDSKREAPVPGGYLPGPPRFERFRATRRDVRRALEDGSAALLDARSPAEFSGTLTAPADAPQEGILRGGHLPGALNVPWDRALRPDGRLRPRGELETLYCQEYAFDPAEPTVAYSRTAARACHAWFVLAQWLGFENVRVYDGGWAEWGNLVAAPVARGSG